MRQNFLICTLKMWYFVYNHWGNMATSGPQNCIIIIIIICNLGGRKNERGPELATFPLKICYKIRPPKILNITISPTRYAPYKMSHQHFTNLKGEEGLIGKQSVVLPNSRRGSTKALQYPRRSKSVTLLHPIRCSSQRRNLYPSWSNRQDGRHQRKWILKRQLPQDCRARPL